MTAAPGLLSHSEWERVRPSARPSARPGLSPRFTDVPLGSRVQGEGSPVNGGAPSQGPGEKPDGWKPLEVSGPLP